MPQLTHEQKTEIIIRRLLIELDYCDERMGHDRSFTRKQVMREAREMVDSRIHEVEDAS